MAKDAIAVIIVPFLALGVWPSFSVRVSTVGDGHPQGVRPMLSGVQPSIALRPSRAHSMAVQDVASLI